MNDKDFLDVCAMIAMHAMITAKNYRLPKMGEMQEDLIAEDSYSLAKSMLKEKKKND
jgi:hypothetical protein